MYKITTIITIEEAIDELELLKWQEGITDFVIIEKFTKVKIFTVSNLSMETEDDIVFCCDDNGIINQQGSILIGFLKHHLLSISKIYDYGVRFGLFEFEDGTVTIKVA